MPSGIATGDINRARFIKLASGADGQVTQCGAGERAAGISQLGTRRSPYIDATTLAAKAGEPVSYFGLDDTCGLELAGTVANGDYLVSDADGKGLASTTDKDDVGAQAEQAGVAGDIVKVRVRIFERSV